MSKTPETTIKQESLAKKTRKLVKSDAFVSLYSNDTQVQATVWDFKLSFGVVHDVPGEAEVTIERSAEVRMSPQHAKKIAQIILAQVGKYEENFGVIPQESA